MLDAEYSESGLEGHFSDAPIPRYEITPSGASKERLLRLPESRRQAPGEPVKTREPSTEEKPKAPEKDETKDREPKKAEQKDNSKNEKKGPGFLRRRPLLSLGLVCLAALAVAAGYVWWENGEHFESTDDAFIAARQIAIAPQITGYVTSVPVTDNQHLDAGDVIAKIDDRNYQAALDQANAQVASAKASIANAEAQTDVQHAQIEAGKAQVDQAKATLAFAQQQASRYGQLAKTGSGSIENAQQYVSQQGQQEAALKTRASQRTRRGAPARGAEGAIGERSGEPFRRQRAARTGAAQCVLYDGQRDGAGQAGQSERGAWGVRAAGHQPHHVRA